MLFSGAFCRLPGKYVVNLEVYPGALRPRTHTAVYLHPVPAMVDLAETPLRRYSSQPIEVGSEL